MCGIFGFYAPRGGDLGPPDLLERMARVLRHRGPDEGGYFREGPIGLGSRRLSIVDLVTGRQPLQNETGDIHLVCNGEIYNAPDLRRDLSRKHTFRTHSDNEVLIHLYEDLGTDFLLPVEGMFALALWDARSSRLLLARDRAGEKPLFHAWRGGVLYFASELAALREVDGIGREIDPEALRLYLAFGYFPAPSTPYREVRKLVPGTMAVIGAGARGPEIIPYWSLRPYAIAGAVASDPAMSLDAAARELRERVEASVRRQLMGDVPAGIALSGGLDSGWIATVAAAESREPLHTFTVSFADPSYDEGSDAAWLARRLGTSHHVARADAGSLARAIDFLAGHLDEPLADPAVLPTFLLAEEARRHVKVVLGGEGADELFAGYPTYVGHRLASGYGAWPGWLRRRIVAPLVAAWPASEGKVSLEFLLKRFTRYADRPPLDRHLAWFGVMTPEEADRVAGRLLGGAGDGGAPRRVLEDLLGAREEWGGADIEQLLYLDFRTYLGEGLLTKLDRVSMSVSLESRSPYLSREVVEFAARLPVRWKLHGLETKWILRRAAGATLPREILRRRKRGLSVPLAAMFRRQLRETLRRDLDPARLDAEGLLNGRAVGEILRSHWDGRADRSRALWAILCLVFWYRRQVLGVSASASASEKSQPFVERPS